MTAVAFVPATAEAAHAYYGGQPPYSFKGYVAMLEDRPIGIGGVYYVGRTPYAFSEMKDEMRPRLKDKARAVRLLENLIATYKTPVFAVASEPTSDGLLRKLGFEPTGHKVESGPVMVRAT